MTSTSIAPTRWTERPDLDLVRGVERRALHALGLVGERLAQRRQRAGVLVHQHQARTLVGEPARDGGADHAGGAGHQGDAPRQRHGRRAVAHGAPSAGPRAGAPAANERRTASTPASITMGTRTSRVEIAVSVGSIS